MNPPAVSSHGVKKSRNRCSLEGDFPPWIALIDEWEKIISSQLLSVSCETI